MATVITPTQPKAWAPDVIGFAADDAIPDSLLLQVGTKAGVIEGDEPAVRVPYVVDDGTAGFVAEGALIPETRARMTSSSSAPGRSPPSGSQPRSVGPAERRPAHHQLDEAQHRDEGQRGVPR